MGFNFNNPVDQDLDPNQASVGPNYQAPMDGAPGNTTIHRRGVITRLDLTGNLTGDRTLTFGDPAVEKWLDGDTVFIQVPTHTDGGGSHTIAVNDTQGNPLVLWGPLVANGGMFVFGAGQDGDFCATVTGTIYTPIT